MTSHLIPLGGDWALWRDVGIRSAGFPVSGLDVFGAGDEAGRLRDVAADPRFREAVTWQNRAVVHTAIDKVASASPASGSKQRQREELVASYWQRYCAKNDTIGFFGPLAWGRMVEEGPALAVEEAPAARSVHFEAWCLEALAEALDLGVQVPLGPYPERDVRIQLEPRPILCAASGDCTRWTGWRLVERRSSQPTLPASTPPSTPSTGSSWH